MAEETKKGKKGKEEGPAEGEIEISLEGVQKELDECRKQKEEYLAGWQRARADFLNYKKEEAEHVSDLLRYSTENIISGILPVLDSFEMAQKTLPAAAKADGNIQGMLQIKIQLLDFLKKQDLEEIRSIGEKFNPNFHDIAAEVSVEGAEPGIIIEEMQKGYTFQGRVIRPARVKIAK
ncbi:MAG: nucleotide exchange factor GrpE [Candidatus Paceibacterota bacterium]|jgi:molecular chaperone GrpE